jgi:HEPN domain-containing protein
MNATERKIAYTKDWFRHSANNLVSAKHLLNDLWPKQTEIAAYLSQQAAETALKGFLYYSGIDDPEHTHNLEKLCKQCIRYDNGFAQYLPYCADLTPLEAQTRYPFELAPTDSDAAAAIAKAQKIHDFCRSKIPELNNNATDEIKIVEEK